MSELVETLQNNLAMQVISLVEQMVPEENLWFLIKILKILFESNKKNPRIDKEEFINDTVSSQLNMFYITKQYHAKTKNRQILNNNKFVYLDYPWIFSTAAKVDVIQNESRLIQNDQVFNNILGGLGGGGGLMGLVNSVHMNLIIRRDQLLEDTLNQLSSKSKQLKKPLKVKFVGEDGVDEGGVRKEFFHLLIAELFNPNFAMFVQLSLIHI